MTKYLIADVARCSGCGRCELACSFYRTRRYSRADSAIHLARVEELGLDFPVTCIGCDRCIDACPNDALARDDGELIAVDEESCDGCGTCADICPTGVLEFSDRPFFCTACGKCIEACNLGVLDFSRSRPPKPGPASSAHAGWKRYLWALDHYESLSWIIEEDARIYRKIAEGRPDAP